MLKETKNCRMRQKLREIAKEAGLEIGCLGHINYETSAGKYRLKFEKNVIRLEQKVCSSWVRASSYQIGKVNPAQWKFQMERIAASLV